MHTPDESEWIVTSHSTEIGIKQDGSFMLQGDSGFHSITPSSLPSLHDMQCPACHSEFDISLNISSDGNDAQTPDANKCVSKLYHSCVKGRKLLKHFSHSETPYFPLKSQCLLTHNDSNTISVCTPGSNDVSSDTSLYMDEEMETDQISMDIDNSSFNESSECNVIFKGDMFISPAVTRSCLKVPAPVSETTGTKKKFVSFIGEKLSKSPKKNEILNTRVELGMIRDLPRRRENRQSKIKGKHSKFRNKYFQPLPIVTCFVGLENIDILYHLQQAQLDLVISNIFSGVDDRDLVSIMRVSKTWKEICSNDRAAYKRYKKISERNISLDLAVKENINSQTKDRLVERTVRGQFLQITNHQTSPAKAKPPEQMSPRRNSWRFLALSENEKASNSNEKMMSCPRCRSLAHDSRNGMPAKCFRISCQYEFCSICKSEYKVGHTCVLLSTPRSRKYTPIGSTASKRNLRRL